MTKLSFLFVCVASFQFLFGQSVTISGTVRERRSGELIPYVVFVDTLNQIGLSSSNSYGFFSFRIQHGRTAIINVKHVGYEPSTFSVFALKDTTLDITLNPLVRQLKDIEVTAQRETFIAGNEYVISGPTIEQVPVLLGEKDALKVLQLLPGVQRGVEGSTAFYVRGGGADQNLIIADDAIIYNATHLFGFLSIFNPDAVKNIHFYKGTFPARYGGRISSVTDIQTKDGNKSTTNVSGGIGILSARLTVNGPIKKDRSSYLLSARRSFIDWLARPFMSSENREAYRLLDAHAKADFRLNECNRLFINGYVGGDNILTRENTRKSQYAINSETQLGWTNRNVSLRWNHIFSKVLFNNISLVQSHYRFYLRDTYQRSGLNENFSYADFNSGIDDYSVKQDMDYYISNRHTLKVGSIYTRHNFTPKIFYSEDKVSKSDDRVKQKYLVNEFSAYLEDSWRILEGLSADFGLRYAYTHSADDAYAQWEPRLDVYYSLTSGMKFNAGYTRSNQFMHLLSNTGIGLPTDLWVPATRMAPPQQGDIVSGGISRAFVEGKYNVSIQTYRRAVRNMIAYRQDAGFLDIGEMSKEIKWEENIASGKAKSYGTEIFFEKKEGKITGWLSYTLGWVIDQFDDINNGKPFFPKYDSRHNISIFLNFNVSGSLNLSANWVYSTGSALTVPQTWYYGNFATGTERRTIVSANKASFPIINEEIAPVPYFGSKNSYRAEAYHRLDISVQFHKRKKRYERYWEFGLFNAYNRKNPFYYYLESSNDFVNRGQRIDLKKKSLFPVLPSITYNFKF